MGKGSGRGISGRERARNIGMKGRERRSRENRGMDGKKGEEVAKGWKEGKKGRISNETLGEKGRTGFKEFEGREKEGVTSEGLEFEIGGVRN